MPAALHPLHRVALAAAAIAVLAGLGWWARRAPAAGTAPAVAARGTVVRATRPLMGSVFEVAVWAPTGREPEAAEAARGALDLAAELEAKVSEWRPDSELSAINRAAGAAAVAVGPETAELVTRMVEWARRTGGAFDPTGGPLFERWERARREKTLPTKEEIEELRTRVGWRQIEVTGTAVRLARPGMRLGTGAIGKGWAADRLGAFLEARGFADYVVDAGGDLRVGGTRGGERWTVAVKNPRGEGMLAVMPARAGGIATSGDYERYFVAGGRRWSHILDLRTGWPASGLASVTVIAPDGAAADALATAVTAMGAEEGLAFVNATPGVRALLVREGGEVLLSRGLRLDGDRLEEIP